jgi:hypothetical protein
MILYVIINIYLDFGRYESKYFMFRMEIDKARSIQKLLLKYIELGLSPVVSIASHLTRIHRE